MTPLVARNSLKFFAPLARPQPIRIAGVLPSQHETYLSARVLYPPSIPPQLSPQMQRHLASLQQLCRPCYEARGLDVLRLELARRVKPDFNVALDAGLVCRLFRGMETVADFVEVLQMDDEAVARAPGATPYEHSFVNGLFLTAFRNLQKREVNGM